jgi:hypothetical protein
MSEWSRHNCCCLVLSTFCSWCNLSSLGNTSSILGNLQKRFYFLYRLNAWLISQEEMCINYAWNKSYSCSVSINFNCINCVKLCRLTLNVENYGFQPWSGQTIDDSIGICCFSLKHAALRSKSNDCCLSELALHRLFLTVKLLIQI